MRILHVVPTYLPAYRHGGPIWAVHGLARALAARGHQVSVFTTDVDGDGRLAVPLAQAVAVDEVEVWYFPVGFPRRLYRSPALSAALAERAGGHDLLHLHSVFLWPTAAAARAARRAGVPYVVSPRGMLVERLLRARGRRRKRAWIRLVERRTLRGAAAIHATSDLEAEELRRLGLDLAPVLVIPNGVAHESWDGDARSLQPAVRAVVGGGPFLLFLGRLSWKKGLEHLVAALAEVPGATLAVAGNDEEDCRPALERLARERGVAGRVAWLGPVYGAEKAALLERCAAFVLPSSSENFGNAALEAMAAGRPVVLSPEVGLAAAVRASGAGVVTAAEPAALAASLRALLADPAGAGEMGRRGARLARERYGWGDVAARMEEAYRGLAGGAAA